MEEVKQLADEIVTDWAEPIKELIVNTDIESMRYGPLYDRDPQCFTLNFPIAIIGDASHPMTPFKGQGANRALVDSITLADLTFNFMKDSNYDFYDFIPQLSQFHQKSMEGAKNFVLGSRSKTFYLHTAESLINPNPKK